jgi:hypothetical protein
MFRQAKARSYMLIVMDQHRDPKTNEINATSLAEDTASHFSVDYAGGPLDDETHWIWDLAATISERYSNR